MQISASPSPWYGTACASHTRFASSTSASWNYGRRSSAPRSATRRRRCQKVSYPSSNTKTGMPPQICKWKSLNWLKHCHRLGTRKCLTGAHAFSHLQFCLNGISRTEELLDADGVGGHAVLLLDPRQRFQGEGVPRRPAASDYTPERVCCLTARQAARRRNSDAICNGVPLCFVMHDDWLTSSRETMCPSHSLKN